MIMVTPWKRKCRKLEVPLGEDGFPTGTYIADFQQLSRLVSIALNTDTEYPLLMWRMATS
jgi:hypothetical protein